VEYIKEVFEKMKTRNKVKVNVVRKSDWWKTDPRNQFYQAAEWAMEKVWMVR